MPIKKPSTQSRDSVNTLSRQGIDTVNDQAADAFINRVNNKPATQDQSEKPKSR
jgi:hypothetical protein